MLKILRMSLVPVVAVSGLALASPALATPSVAEVCIAETYEWLGSVTLAPNDTMSLGAAVPIELGTEVRMRGYSWSAEPVDSAFISVAVGGVVALEDARVEGGEIIATNIGPSEIELTTVGIVVDRCSLVSQAAPPAAPEDTVAPGDDEVTFTTLDPSLSGELPETGARLDRIGALTIVAATLSALGAALVALSRRRPARP